MPTLFNYASKMHSGFTGESENEALENVTDEEIKDDIREMFDTQDEKMQMVLAHVEKFDAVDRIVALTPISVVYATGQRGAVGSTVNYVDGTSKVIEAISYESRFVLYDDGSRDFFSNSYGMLNRASEDIKSTAELREYLQSTSSIADASADTSDGGDTSNDLDIRLGSRRSSKVSR